MTANSCSFFLSGKLLLLLLLIITMMQLNITPRALIETIAIIIKVVQIIATVKQLQQ